jgi:hypothetical protein
MQRSLASNAIFFLKQAAAQVHPVRVGEVTVDWGLFGCVPAAQRRLV